MFGFPFLHGNITCCGSCRWRVFTNFSYA